MELRDVYNVYMWTCAPTALLETLLRIRFIMLSDGRTEEINQRPGFEKLCLGGQGLHSRGPNRVKNASQWVSCTSILLHPSLTDKIYL